MSGRILSDAGEGLPGVEVELLRRAYLPGGSQPVAVAFAQTEERGTFRFGNVTSGEYYVRAYAPQSIVPTHEDTSLSYVATFFSERPTSRSRSLSSSPAARSLPGVDFAADDREDARRQRPARRSERRLVWQRQSFT